MSSAMSLRSALFGLAATLASVASLPAWAGIGPPCSPSISFAESLVGSTGQYTISTGNLCGYNIIAAFVDNNQSQGAFTFRSGWGAEVISRATWNGVGNGT